MNHPFYYIKRRHKGPPTLRHINNSKNKTPNWSLQLKKNLKAMKIIKVMPLELSCFLSFSA